MFALITYFVFYLKLFGVSANYPPELKEFPMTITNILIMIIFELLWIQDIKLITLPSDDKYTKQSKYIMHHTPVY